MVKARNKQMRNKKVILTIVYLTHKIVVINCKTTGVIVLQRASTLDLGSMYFEVIKKINGSYKIIIFKELIIVIENTIPFKTSLTLYKVLRDFIKLGNSMFLQKNIYNCFKKTGFSELGNSMDSDCDEEVTLVDLTVGKK